MAIATPFLKVSNAIMGTLSGAQQVSESAGKEAGNLGKKALDIVISKINKL